MNRTVVFTGWNLSMNHIIVPLPWVLQAQRLFDGQITFGDVTNRGHIDAFVTTVWDADTAHPATRRFQPLADIDRTRTIAAAPAEIWDVLADFGAIASWVDKVDHSCILVHRANGQPLGTARRVQMGRDTLVERITEFDPPRTLAYDIDGLPKLMGRVSNRWTLRATADDSTVVTVTSRVHIGPRPRHQLAERLASRVVARQSDGMLAGLAKRLESARV